MTLRQRNKVGVLVLFCAMVLNSLVAFVFPFLSFQKILLIYVVNFLPVALFILLLRRQRRQGKVRGGFVFLYLMLFKFIYILSFLFIYNRKFTISREFLINFLLVYLIFLYLSIFIGVGFLSEKNKG